MKNTLFIRLIAYTLIASGLLACSNNVHHIIVSPEVMQTTSNHYQGKQANITFSDLRTISHIVQIKRPDTEVAQLYSAQNPLLPIIKTTLTAAFEKNALQVAPLASNQIDVIVEKALINVEQTLVKYQATNTLAIRVVVNNGKETLTKNFMTNGKSKGPFSADLAVLERDFNQQLSQLLLQIVENPDIKNAIK